MIEALYCRAVVVGWLFVGDWLVDCCRLLVLGWITAGTHRDTGPGRICVDEEVRFGRQVRGPSIRFHVIGSHTRHGRAVTAGRNDQDNRRRGKTHQGTGQGGNAGVGAGPGHKPSTKLDNHASNSFIYIFYLYIYIYAIYVYRIVIIILCIGHLRR